MLKIFLIILGAILVGIVLSSVVYLAVTYENPEKEAQIKGLENDIKYLQSELSRENTETKELEKKVKFLESHLSINEVSIPLETHSKCGVGTIFERQTNSCILKDVINPEEWCGLGTYYNATEHSCLLKKTIDPKFNHKV